MILTFDIDGVVCGGEFIPEWERYPETYLNLPVLDPILPAYFHDLAKKYSLYLISSRKFPNALDITKLWLNKNDFCPTDFSGVIVGLQYEEKVKMVRLLQSILHVDDDFRVTGPLGLKGCLLLHDSIKVHYPWSSKAVEAGHVVYHDWKDVLAKIYSLPYGAAKDAP